MDLRTQIKMKTYVRTIELMIAHIKAELTGVNWDD